MALDKRRGYSISKGAQPFKEANQEYEDAKQKLEYTEQRLKTEKQKFEQNVSRVTILDGNYDLFLSNEEIGKIMDDEHIDKLPDDYWAQEGFGGSVRFDSLKLHHYKKGSEEARKLNDIFL